MITAARQLKRLFLRDPAPGRTARRGAVHASFAVRGGLSPRADLLVGVAGVAALLAVWCALTYGGFVGEFFLPKPTDIWQGTLDLYHRGLLVPAIWRSFVRVTKALGFVILLGVPVGILCGTFAPVDAFLRKIINGGKSIPTSGLLGLVVLWFGATEQGKILFLFLGAIFFMIVLVKSAVRGVNEEYVRVALDLGAGRAQVVRYVLLPGALPQIWDAVAVCNGIMWTYIVLVEFINANISNEENLGLGVLLRASTVSNRPAHVFSMLILIAVISSLTDFVLNVVRRRLFDW
jgi:NitT/TauT family transport system permease protein